MERQQVKNGVKPNPLLVLSDHISRLEASLNGNLGLLFRNHQELKHGLDAAEVNQRALVKVVVDLCKGLGVTWPTSLEGVSKPAEPITSDQCVFPVRLLEGKVIDWGSYYREAEDDIEQDKLATYKISVANLITRVDAIDKALPDFEAGLDAELEEQGVTSKEHPRAQAVLRFLNDLKAEMARVRAAQEAITKNEGKIKIEEFNTRILSDTQLMISRQKAKKVSKEQGVGPAGDESTMVGQLSEETVTEFGG